MGSPDAFVGPPPVFPDRRAATPTSLLFGEAGVWWASALVHGRLGDLPALSRATVAFCGLADYCPEGDLDLASGAAGLLVGAATLVEEAPGPVPERLVAVGDRLARLLDQAAVAWERGEADPLGWLGAAHGWCGVATAGLRWCQATGAAPSPSLHSLLTRLRAARLASGAWPRRDGSAEVWPGWCHGSAGWAQLWVLAAQVTGDDAFLALAEAPGVHAVVGRGGGASLCCGLAGRAYAALALFGATGEPTWLTHAQRLGDEAARAAVGPDLPEHSLWGGDVGVTLLALDIGNPGQAAMPVVAAASSAA